MRERSAHRLQSDPQKRSARPYTRTHRRRNGPWGSERPARAAPRPSKSPPVRPRSRSALTCERSRMSACLGSEMCDCVSCGMGDVKGRGAK